MQYFQTYNDSIFALNNIDLPDFKQSSSPLDPAYMDGSYFEAFNDDFLPYDNSVDFNNMFNQVNDNYLQSPFEDFDADLPEINPISRESRTTSSSSTHSSLSYNSKKIQKMPTANISCSSKEEFKGKKCPWKSHEDAQVLELVIKHGHCWATIAKALGNRTGKQVRDRYRNYLKADINNKEFTPEEDEHLLQLYNQIGNKWCKIAECMSGRTECQVKNRFHVYLKKNLEKREKVEITPNFAGNKSCAHGRIERDTLITSEGSGDFFESSFALFQHDAKVDEEYLADIEQEIESYNLEQKRLYQQLNRRKEILKQLYDKTVEELINIKSS